MIPENRKPEHDQAERGEEQLLYSAEQAAAKLGGITTRYLRILASDGKITPTRVGRRVMFTQKELAAFVARCEQESATKAGAA